MFLIVIVYITRVIIALIVMQKFENYFWITLRVLFSSLSVQNILMKENFTFQKFWKNCPICYQQNKAMIK